MKTKGSEEKSHARQTTDFKLHCNQHVFSLLHRCRSFLHHLHLPQTSSLTSFAFCLLKNLTYLSLPTATSLSVYSSGNFIPNQSSFNGATPVGGVISTSSILLAMVFNGDVEVSSRYHEFIPTVYLPLSSQF